MCLLPAGGRGLVSGLNLVSVGQNPLQHVIKLLFHAIISFYEAAGVSIPQIEIWTFSGLNIISQLPLIIEEVPARVQREEAHLHRLLVQGEVSLIQLSASAQSPGRSVLGFIRCCSVSFIAVIITAGVSRSFRNRVMEMVPAVALSHGLFLLVYDELTPLLISVFLANAHLPYE